MSLIQRILLGIYNIVVSPFFIAAEALTNFDLVGAVLAPYQGLRKTGWDFYDEFYLLVRVVYSIAFWYVLFLIIQRFLF